MSTKKLHKWPIYKTRLWLSSLNGDLLTPKQYEIWVFIAGWGPKGSDSWNWRIARDCRCSIRTVQRALNQLRKHALILSSGDLGKHRRLIACLYPTRQAWEIKAFQNLAKNSFPNGWKSAGSGVTKMSPIKDVQRKSLNYAREEPGKSFEDRRQKILRDLFSTEAIAETTSAKAR